MKKLILLLILIPHLIFSQGVCISYEDSFVRLKAPVGNWKVVIRQKDRKLIWKNKCYLTQESVLCLPFLQDLPKSEYVVSVSRRGKRFKTKLTN